MTWLTETHERQLRQQLLQLPELSALAATTLGGERLAGERGASSVPGPRPPLNVAAAALTGRRDLSADPTEWPIRGGGLVWVDGRGRVHADAELPGSVVSVLADWTRLAHAELIDDHQRALDWQWSEPTPLDDVPTVAGECAWLLRHIVWILEQQWVDELAADVRRLTEECRQVLRIRPTYRPHCPREGCSGLLIEEGSGLWRCGDCGHTAGDRGRLDLRRIVAQQQPMTVAQLVRGFGISINTIKSWTQRGALTPENPGESPLKYHPVDVLRLAAEGGASSA